MRVPVPKRPDVHYAELSKLVSRLNYPVHWHVKLMKTPEGSEGRGPEARLKKMRETVTALLKYERIEVNWPRGDEARGYAERLISEAIRHGPQCTETMEMADWWLEEKQVVHKLFKVLVPRFQHCPTSFTTMYTAPYWRFSDGFTPSLNEEYPDRELNETIGAHRAVVVKKALLELKGHPYPPVYRTHYSNPGFIQNVLLSSAKDFFKHLQAQTNHENQKPSEDENCSSSSDNHHHEPTDPPKNVEATSK